MILEHSHEASSWIVSYEILYIYINQYMIKHLGGANPFTSIHHLGVQIHKSFLFVVFFFKIYNFFSYAFSKTSCLSIPCGK